jgi:hypothetical protein
VRSRTSKAVAVREQQQCFSSYASCTRTHTHTRAHENERERAHTPITKRRPRNPRVGKVFFLSLYSFLIFFSIPILSISNFAFLKRKRKRRKRESIYNEKKVVFVSSRKKGEKEKRKKRKPKKKKKCRIGEEKKRVGEKGD